MVDACARIEFYSTIAFLQHLARPSAAKLLRQPIILKHKKFDISIVYTPSMIKHRDATNSFHST
jgi:hypothetical protein